MALLYALTLFTSAALLFAVQPMVGRMLLPMLGGSPAVWNTCMVFFQAVLLLGYLYAHLSAARLGPRRQAAVHLVVLLLPLAVLPIVVDRGSAPSAEAPALWLLGTLTLAVGLPFFALSTSAPVLQRWFAATGHRSASDPYFLYAASNAGSLLALLAYPFVLEPLLGLAGQSRAWLWGYLAFVGLCAACALTLLVRRPEQGEVVGPAADGAVPAPAVETPGTQNSSGPLRWVTLAFVPSSLLLGVTTYLTTDIAPVPLLWVVPLSLYLLTFVLAFSSRVVLPLRLLGRTTAIGVLSLALVLLVGATEPVALVLSLHLATFFCAALLCHGLLARARPPAERLTVFYLCLSVGGVLGGLFNALLAPVLFHKLGNVEYPLLLILITLARPLPSAGARLGRWDVVAPVLVALAALGLVLAVRAAPSLEEQFKMLAKRTGLQPEMVKNGALFGLPLLVVYTFIDRGVRFALGLGLLFVVGAFAPGPLGETLYLERNFLGTIRVTADASGQVRKMVHGNTIHGQQRSGVPEPITYYHRTGPVGVMFRQLVSRWKGPLRVGAVGLGTGSLAYYARPEEDWIFFELDPAVERIARDERFFTYLRDTRAKSMRVILGDARLALAAQPDASFDLLILDAFSSDAIPVHLLTAEALDLYRQKLRPCGVILFHISNRYLDLAPVLDKLASTAEQPWVIRFGDDLNVTSEELDEGKARSQWLLMARREEDLGPLTRSIRWMSAPSGAFMPRWTDDHANLLSAWRRAEDE